MIANDREYRITRGLRERFEHSVELTIRDYDVNDPKVAIQIAAHRSKIRDFDNELAEYEALRAATPHVVPAASLDELPETLIRARIARLLTQKELAGLLGLKEQQVQRYEATRYRGVSIERIAKVAQVLNIEITGRMLPG